MMSQKVMLVILDGWGIGSDDARSAIAQADKPYFDKLMKNNPHSQLLTHGRNVGLPIGQMGNSEVGHLNIGAGRVVYQDLVLINKAIEDHTLGENDVLQSMIAGLKATGGKLHLMGLLSDGGVHSHIDHLFALLEYVESEGISNVLVHAFLDGRDTDPKGGKGYIGRLNQFLKGRPSKLASIVGRYYAMDRDRRWERIKVAFDALVYGKGELSNNVERSVQTSYENKVTDEFIKPIINVDDSGRPIGQIQNGDYVLFFNFRSDRPRQLTEVLSQTDHAEMGMNKLDLHYYTMTEYDKDFKNVNVLFKKEKVNGTLGEIVSNAGRTQLRSAETEKYAHVTYFFNGGREEVFSNEDRLLVNSPKVATYDLKPEMSAFEVTDEMVKRINADHPDLIVLNYANTDMVGHTGVFEAAVKAVEAVDKCLQRLFTAALAHGYKIIVIADHGNSDYMVNQDGSPNTAHSTNPVPCILVGEREEVRLRDGILADVAPTILELMGLEQPDVMTGRSLIEGN
jgi:2,3-bisphosphoglycerate-independent phosphoglycerate mutase